ncbi:hypothetical protein REPUB_Repub07fG0141300 [Reevesia pubescens]
MYPLRKLIEDIHILKARHWVCNLTHIHREGNFCADVLAKSGCDLELDLEQLRLLPSFMTEHIHANKWGVQFPRGFKHF